MEWHSHESHGNSSKSNSLKKAPNQGPKGVAVPIYVAVFNHDTIITGSCLPRQPINHFMRPMYEIKELTP